MDKAPITVFGGTGFLGRRLVTALLQRGHAVRLAARRPERVRFHDETRLERRVADVTDPGQVAAAVARRLPGAPLTRDQVFLMEEDNVAAPDVPGFIELDRRPRGFREGLPDCLGPRPR